MVSEDRKLFFQALRYLDTRGTFEFKRDATYHTHEIAAISVESS